MARGGLNVTLERRYAEGATLREIAADVGVSHTTVSRRLQDAGVKRRRGGWTFSRKRPGWVPLCGCGRDYLTVALDEAHVCPNPIMRYAP